MTSAKLLSSLFFFFFTTLVCAQNIEEHRIVNWSDAGLTSSFQNDNVIINFIDNGGDYDGDHCNASLLQSLIDQADYGTTIYFDEGTFYFEETIHLKRILQIILVITS